MIWPPFQPPAWNAPATDPAETQQPAPAESSGLAREFFLDSNQVPWSSGLGRGHLAMGIGAGHLLYPWGGWDSFQSLGGSGRHSFCLSVASGS